MTTQTAIRKVLVLDSQKSYWLALEILRNCFLAATYKEKKRIESLPQQTPVARGRPLGRFRDPSQRRRSIRDYMACRAQVRKSIKRIRSILKTYSLESAQDIGYANLIMREKYPSVPAIPFAFENVLECLELALLEPKVFGLNTGAMLHRVAVGPLIYPMPVDQQKAQPHAALNGLIFYLSFHFRRASTGRQGEGWMNGEPMPQEGKSHIPLIAHFARAAFNNETITPVTVKKRLDSLLKVRNKETSNTITLSAWPPENSPSHA